MTTLQQIQEGWKIGYAAAISNGCGCCNHKRVIVGVGDKKVIMRSYDDGITEIHGKAIEALNIEGFLYAGELAGNEPIKKGHRFRVKETGEEIEYRMFDEPVKLGFLDSKGKAQYFTRKEVEPISNPHPHET